MIHGKMGALLVVFSLMVLSPGLLSGNDISHREVHIINDIHELQAMADHPDRHYVLGNHIDASSTYAWNQGSGFMPVGDTANPFSGVLDGGGYAITGLHIHRPERDMVGLFGVLGTGSAVHDLELRDVNITGRNYVGALVGDNQGTITNTSVRGEVRGNGLYTGGLAGSNDGGLIGDSAAEICVSGGEAVGGLTGIIGFQGMVSNSSATGTVQGSNHVGGLAGLLFSGFLYDSFSSSDVTGIEGVGGLAGSGMLSIVKRSYSKSSVTGIDSVGGLMGHNWDGSVENTYATGEVDGEIRTGGLVGFNEVGTVRTSYAAVVLDARGSVGGLIGNNTGMVEGSFWDTDVSGTVHSHGGLGLNTTAMKTRNSFSEWDFENIWHMVDDFTYPRLRWVTLPFILPLHASSHDGWNFVSLNIIPSDTTPEAILADIEGNYDRLKWYDAYHEVWRTHVPGRPGHYNSLDIWDHTMGMWLRVTEDVTLYVEGTVPETTDITLYPGWNLVGVPDPTPGNHDLPTEVTRVGYFDASQDYNVAYDHDPENFIFTPGQGYWVYNGAGYEVTWTVGIHEG